MTQHPGDLFVIQHHLATADHYDFRLEIDGVLVSWAVPKGPSTDPREKRMAKRVGDHSLDYADFEGVLSSDRYHGGSVIVWDHGTYTNTSHDRSGGPVDAGDALARGHLSFVLHGSKVRGGYALTQFRDDGTWLLVKKKDADADARRHPTRTEPASVISGRTLDDMHREHGGPEVPA